ncbi:hypothetical protein SKAU_G00414930 [Synaphobranchus kaupii]|uniref:Uncharacterized protein n=1 Tax=Synaphobranchus kaupii TaxID=118154 RepID=A0A9Q1E770_SYNKA|nr:hypothetical protein SKAU_G00414930 [Synaphobranchus kaupii]
MAAADPPAMILCVVEADRHDDSHEVELWDAPVALLIVVSDNVKDPVHYQPVKISIVLGSDVVTNLCQPADVFLVIFGLIYALDLSYPNGLNNTFKFVQKTWIGGWEIVT